MKKVILFIGLVLITISSFGQQLNPSRPIQPGQKPDTVVNFVKPYSFFTDASIFTDSASLLAVKVNETLSTAVFTYTIFSTKNKPLHSGTDTCTGSCFTAWQNNHTAHNEAIIVGNYIHHPVQ